MDALPYLHMLRDMKDVTFATVDEEGHPQARIIDIMLVDDKGLYFLTARGKNFYRELITTGRVAVAGMNKQWQAVRLSGKVRPLEHRYWLDRMFEANPSMHEIYPGATRSILEPFHLYAARGEYFSLAQTPPDRKEFCFGGMDIIPGGYCIDDCCISCGTCLEHCPEQCISPASPYVIQDEHCVRCGNCAEHCPTGAVRRRSQS